MFMAPSLKNRIAIQRVIDQDVFENGGLGNNYDTIKWLWAEVKNISNTIIFRGQNTEDIGTHSIRIRRDSVKSLGAQFSLGFNHGFKSFADLNTIKSDYFLFLKKGSSKGRRFRIMSTNQDEQNDEFLKIMAMENEEVGTGYRAE